MVILALDPGSHSLGFCVIRDGVLAEAGVIEGGSGDLPDRLCLIYREVGLLLVAPTPDLVVIEQAQFHPSKPGAVVPLAEVIGVCHLAARQDGLPILDLPSTRWKAMVTGSGTASKTTVRRFVEQALGADFSSSPFDASDAAGLALAGMRMQERRRAA